MSKSRKAEEEDPVFEDDPGVEPVAPEEEAPGPGEPYEALVIDPPPDEPAAKVATVRAEESSLEVPTGHNAVVYRGAADAIFVGDHLFRPDEPVIVPSEVAEELLTTPFERFETV